MRNIEVKIEIDWNDAVILSLKSNGLGFGRDSLKGMKGYFAWRQPLQFTRTRLVLYGSLL